ncbi:hypothetical protein TRV_06717 [Trichophyton verrucosum HKI 0517]|uniref:Uncharacterized protein n=1 Tax=Trichophyton verrucosum (strain HKI 0517) TaxID=663202 RepID=D4DHR0_TRIVH|nr:uncharacterized protein TRV_06717 [Trichophyton verrucosum HKI 0517]EFE38609.1 hypothetical protein TRV_06717 [Trichophyton verrucosum HKI 0517]
MHRFFFPLVLSSLRLLSARPLFASSSSSSSSPWAKLDYRPSSLTMLRGKQIGDDIKMLVASSGEKKGGCGLDNEKKGQQGADKSQHLLHLLFYFPHCRDWLESRQESDKSCIQCGSFFTGGGGGEKEKKDIDVLSDQEKDDDQGVEVSSKTNERLEVAAAVETHFRGLYKGRGAFFFLLLSSNYLIVERPFPPPSSLLFFSLSTTRDDWDGALYGSTTFIRRWRRVSENGTIQKAETTMIGKTKGRKAEAVERAGRLP